MHADPTRKTVHRSTRVLRRLLVAAVVVATAALVPVSQVGAGLPAPEGPWGYTYGIRVTGFDGPCDFYRVAMGNGVAELLGSEHACADGLAFSPGGVLYGYTLAESRGAGGASSLVTIDPATGAQSVVGGMGRGFFEGGMTFDAAGNLWLYAVPDDDSCATGPSCLYSVDVGTGASTPVGGEEAFLASGSTADCSTVFATGGQISGIVGGDLNAIDTGDGGATSIGPLGFSAFPAGLDFAADGTLYVLANAPMNGPLFDAPIVAVVDPATGAAGIPVEWLSNDPIPNEVFGLAIAGLTCEAPAPEPAVVTPTFTG